MKFLKNATTIDFTRFQDATTVFLTMYRENNHKKLPNYFSPKWANHSIYNGLMVVLIVRNMERECNEVKNLYNH